jgi:hypothetical protein
MANNGRAGAWKDNAGMGRIAKIERGSEAWALLMDALSEETGASYVRIADDGGTLKVKVDEGGWTWPLDVVAPKIVPGSPFDREVI